MPTVRLPTALRRYAGGHHAVEVAAGTVAEALAEVCSFHPELAVRLLDEQGSYQPHLAVFVGEQRIERGDAAATRLEDGDVVIVLVAISGGVHDVRMRGFRDRATVDEALRAALDGLAPLPPEVLDSVSSADRVLAADVVSGVSVPGFRRATMDGYAVRAEDTYGASGYAPIVLRLEGESMPGSSSGDGPESGGAVRIMTGAPVPAGADAVLRAEDASESGVGVEIRAPVAPGRNIGRVGEDVRSGSLVLDRGRRLLPQDIGLLAAIGVSSVEVHGRPSVRIIVSGDELVAPGEPPGGVRIADSNSPMLAALVERDGGIVTEIVRLPDGMEPMREALSRPGADVVVTAGAASVGREDHTPVLVAEMGTLPVHGVAMRPSSPTGIGRIDERPVFLLPGNPVSCLVAYDFFAGPAVRLLGGRSPDWPYPVERMPLGGPLASQIGRVDVARVAIEDEAAVPLAIGGASVLTSVTGADGFVVVPAGSEGHPEGSEVDVHRYGGTR